jgi:hypothetical protein
MVFLIVKYIVTPEKRSFIVDKLAKYFFEHLILDFEGVLDIEELKKLVSGSPEGMQILDVIKSDDDVEDFIIAMTDSLKDHLEAGITGAVLTKEFMTYTQQ